MNALEKIETEKWLLNDESTFTYYKWIKNNNYFKEEKKAYKNGEMNNKVDEEMKELLDELVEVDYEAEVDLDLKLMEIIKRPAKILVKYKAMIEAEYGITIDIVDFWEKYYANINLTEPGAKEKMRENSIIKQIIQHATEEKEKFENIKNGIEIGRANSEPSTHSPFEAYFSSKENYDFAITALKYFSIIDENGKYMLEGRKEGILSGFMDALVLNNIFPKQSDKLMHEKFCNIVGIAYKRFKRESLQYENMKNITDKYCKQLKKRN